MRAIFPAEYVMLEHMIDKVGLSRVVGALADIANEKAEHVLSNWQDERLSRDWETAGRKLDTVASNFPISIS